MAEALDSIERAAAYSKDAVVFCSFWAGPYVGFGPNGPTYFNNSGPKNNVEWQQALTKYFTFNMAAFLTVGLRDTRLTLGVHDSQWVMRRETTVDKISPGAYREKCAWVPLVVSVVAFSFRPSACMIIAAFSRSPHLASRWPRRTPTLPRLYGTPITKAFSPAHQTPPAVQLRPTGTCARPRPPRLPPRADPRTPAAAPSQVPRPREAPGCPAWPEGASGPVQVSSVCFRVSGAGGGQPHRPPVPL